MDAGSDVIFFGITRDILGNVGIAVMTILASAVGFLIASYVSRLQARKNLKRQKLEEFCVSIHDAMFNIARISGSALTRKGDKIPLTSEIEPYAAGMMQALGRMHVYKMLHLSNDFDRLYHKVIQASRVPGVIMEGGGYAYSKDRLWDLLGVLHDLNTLVWQEFKAVIK